MAGDRQQSPGPRAGAPRRRVLTAAALAPALAAAPTPARARPAVLPAERGTRELIEPVPTTLADWKAVARTLGHTGDMKRKVMYHTGFPRQDLRVVSHHVNVHSSLALGSHVSFVRYADHSTLMMGDLVVTEDELQDFIDTLQEHHIAQTALHKHLLSQRPDIWWVHVHRHGHDPLAMARGIRAAFDGTGTPHPAAAPDDTVDLDAAGIDNALGARGTVDDGIYKHIFVRREQITDGPLVLPPGLGSTTAFNFQPLGHGRTAISADCCMIADEVQPVLRALRRAGAKLIELHNHGLRDRPRLFFVHFWLVGDAVQLAGALRPAVDATNVVPVVT